APRIGPVVVNLTPQQVAANAPHMFILAQAVQVLVADEYIVDVLHLEGEMVEAGSLILHAEERMMIHIIITSIDSAELTNDVLFLPSVDIVRADQTECLTEPANGLLVPRGAKDCVADPLHTGRTSGEANDLASAVQGLDT